MIVTAEHAASKVVSRADLFQDDQKLGLGSIEATGIGKATKAGLGSDADVLFRHAVVTSTTLASRATDLKLSIVTSCLSATIAKVLSVPIG